MKIIILSLLIACFFAARLNKIQPEVLAELDLNGGVADIFVEFHEKVNFNELSKGESYDNMESSKRGKLVYESLLDVATWAQAPIRSYLTERKIEFTPFFIDNLISIPKANKRVIDFIVSQREVKRVYQNIKINLEELEKPRPSVKSTKRIEKGIAWVKAPGVWAKGFKGKGVIIANSDTGITHTHEAIRNTYGGKDGNHNFHWFDGSTPRSNTPIDGHGHGTQ
jgi:ribosomal protein S8